MADSITLKIDGHSVTVPAGTLIVEAAKRADNDIPVFCYHPKLEPVGMCRMCLVEVGTPLRDRESGELQLDEHGEAKINWMPKLQTACTVPVSAGMQVRSASEKVTRARKDVVEFLLTSHPLDCPVCDKGGECPLQNLTMRHGPGKSRYLFDEKMQLQKRVPLGDLIFLDRERCIQCARCTRFQDELVGEPVIGFDQRGRALQIVTFSEPGFDSHFSGNTTDICPVGALTSADFRFGARPWELQHAPSICPHCAVGCNTHLNTRRSGRDGEAIIKRVMPRQNEKVNEIWLCDKGRFGHHFVGSAERLTVPLLRRNDQLMESSWEQALQLVAERLRAAGGEVAGLVGERLANEDLFAFRTLLEGVGGRAAQWPGRMGGGELAQQVGVGVGTDLAKLGADTVILVVASDLAEEAPLWWFKVRQAATKAGATADKNRATLIVANARETKLDRCATNSVRYRYGDEVRTVLALTHAISGGEAGLASSIVAQHNTRVAEAARAIAAAENMIIIFGSEGLDYSGSSALAQACANLLITGGHVGRVGSGLLPVWPGNNTQGAWDMGVRSAGMPVPEFTAGAGVVLLAGADPVGDGDVLPEDAFVVVSELFSTESARRADVVLPAQAFAEREGSYTSGDRRVQRFYPALPARGQTLPDWQVFARLSETLGLGAAPTGAAAVMRQIAAAIPHYAGITFERLAAVEQQWPHVGGRDSYYGGASFPNTAGLGVQTPTRAEMGHDLPRGDVHPPAVASGDLLAVPVTLLYDRGSAIARSEIMHPRLPEAYIELNMADANRADVGSGDRVALRVNGHDWELAARVSDRPPQGAVLLPRSLGGPPLACITPAVLRKVES